MKVKYHFEIMNLDDGMVAVPVGNDTEIFHGVLKVNDSAVAILKLLEQETTEETIVNALMKEYEGEKEVITGLVHEFVDTLKNEGILE